MYFTEKVAESAGGNSRKSSNAGWEAENRITLKPERSTLRPHGGMQRQSSNLARKLGARVIASWRKHVRKI